MNKEIVILCNVDTISSNVESDIQGLIDIRKSHINNPIICYLNINKVSNKIVKLPEFVLKFQYI